MKEIGGYFELELRRGQEYHFEAIRLNSGRNALEYILRLRRYSKIYLPFFTCDVLLQPVKKLNIEYEFYSINEFLEPLFDFNKIKENKCFLYVNYFGLKDDYVKYLSGVCENIIIDNAQSFFSKPIKGIDTFYSPRKFFGLPDGAYVFSDLNGNHNLLKKDVSWQKMHHLLIRLDEGAEKGFRKFLKTDKSLAEKPIKRMSNLTISLLKNIDYSFVAKIRLENYNYLNKALEKKNHLRIQKPENQIPMIYPFWSNDITLRSRLIENKIYVATYWPNVLEWCNVEMFEYSLTKSLIPLPIDQRYGIEEMKKIIDLIL